MTSAYRLASGLLVLPLALVLGCDTEASPLGWTIVFENPADLAGTAVVVTSVIEGGCAGDNVVYTGTIRLPDGNAPAPAEELGSGLHGFRVEARNASCMTISSVCDDHELPLDQATITSRLAAGAPGGGCPPGTECDGNGNCMTVIPPDGGMMIPCETEGAACDDGMGGPMGICHMGECCLGCWDGSDCQAGTTAASCGSAGGMCDVCDPGDTCQASACETTSTNPSFDLSPRAVFYKHTSGVYWANGDDSMFDQLGPVAAPGNNLRGYTGSVRFIDVAAAEIATAGIEAGSGNLYTWGTNGAGILGSGSTEFSRVVDTPTQISSLDTFRQVEAGAGFFCAIHTDGALFCWGTNLSGQLGTGDTVFRAAPAQIGDRQWITLSAGFEHTCAIRDDRALFCWGKNDDGRLGDGSMTVRSSPSQVGTSNDWVAVSAGVGHSCGIRVVSGERRLYCWGRSNSGVLGIGDPMGTTSFAEPQEVRGGLTGWQAVSAGEFHTCGLVDRGSGVEALCWGFPGFGALGNGDPMVTALDPIAVDLMPNSGWSAITAGYQQTCGIAAGVAYCWGDSRVDAMMMIDNSWLGIGATEVTASPTPVVFDPALP